MTDLGAPNSTQNSRNDRRLLNERTKADMERVVINISFLSGGWRRECKMWPRQLDALSCRPGKKSLDQDQSQQYCEQTVVHCLGWKNEWRCGSR